MFDIDKLANDLANYVKNGALTKENAEAVYEAACIKYGFDPETGEYIGESCDDDYEESFDEYDLESVLEDDYDMTLEAALDTLKDTFDEVKDAAGTKLKETGRAAEKKVNQLKFQHNLNKIKKSSEKTVKDTQKGIKKASDKTLDEMRKLKKEAGKKVREIQDDAEYVGDKVKAKAGEVGDRAKAKAGEIKDSVQAKVDETLTEENKAKAKEFAKEHAFVIAASTVALVAISTGAIMLLSKNDQDNLRKIAKAKSDIGKGNPKDPNYQKKVHKYFEFLNTGENASLIKKVKSFVGSKKANVKKESTMDLINDFLYERIMEAESTAPAETNPATHVEDEIDEKLPSETPNEPDCIGCYEDIEKTDKAIEDSKKYLDVASKLAEMKSAHEAEKDTTQQHETIDQATESTEEIINATKLNIYDSYEAGLLTASEKNELLSYFESDDDGQKNNIKKLLKITGLVIAFVTAVPLLIISYMAIRETHRKLKVSHDDIKTLRKYKEELKSINDELNRKINSSEDLPNDEFNRYLKTISEKYSTAKVIANHVINYDGIGPQKNKAKKLMNEIDELLND